MATNRKVRKNAQGNWVGYEGRSRVMEFGENWERAEEWAAGAEVSTTTSVEGGSGFKFKFG